jgi:hypothetical protein
MTIKVYFATPPLTQFVHAYADTPLPEVRALNECEKA